jgi:hypothetical protein
MKRKGIIIAKTTERARRFGQTRINDCVVRVNREELETPTHVYKFKGCDKDILRGYRDIEELYIQYDIPVGAYFETVLPYLHRDCKVNIFD